MWCVVPAKTSDELKECEWSRETPAPECVAWVWVQREIQDDRSVTVSRLQDWAGYSRRRAHRILRAIRDVTQAVAA